MSIDLIDHSLQTFTLRTAILLYGRDASAPEYATVHPIDMVPKGQPVIRAGRPISAASLASFAALFAGSHQAHSGLLPSNVLSIGPNHTIWWRPPQKRSIFFRGSELPAADDDDEHPSAKVKVGTRRGVSPHPGLIFVVRGDSWYIYAVKGDQRPTGDTHVYVAPYFNVWTGGKICTGNVRRPKSQLADHIAAWESAFFDSNFTHPNAHLLTRYPSGIHQLWIDLLEGRHEQFPEDTLVPLREQAVGVHPPRRRRKPGTGSTKPLAPTTMNHLIAHFEHLRDQNEDD